MLQIQFSDSPQLENCCNEHDICYDTCNSNRTECDLDLQTCTRNMCANAHKEAGAASDAKALAGKRTRVIFE